MTSAPILDLDGIVAKLLAFKGIDLSESDTEAKLVLPVLNFLGWSEEGDAKIVRQVATSTSGPRRVPDFRLLLHGTCVAIIETKRASHELIDESSTKNQDPLTALTAAGRKALDQVFRYALDEGVPLVWLTNGFQHLAARVFLQNTPLEQRVIFFCQQPADLIVSYNTVLNFRPERIEALLLAGSSASAPKEKSPAATIVSKLGEVFSAASLPHLEKLSDSSFGSNHTPVRKYSNRLHVSRAQHHDLLARFLESPSPVLVYSGEAGAGKTSLLCELMEEYPLRENSLPLFVNAGVLSVGLFHHLRSTLDSFSSEGGGLQRFLAAVARVEDYALSRSRFVSALANEPPDPIAGRRALALFEQFEQASEAEEFLADYVLILRWLATQTAEIGPDRGILEDTATFLENSQLLAKLIVRLTRAPKRFGSEKQPRFIRSLLEVAESADEAFKERPINKSSMTVALRRLAELIETKPQWMIEFSRSNARSLLSGRMKSVRLSFFAASLSWSERGGEPTSEDWDRGKTLSRVLARVLESIARRPEEDLGNVSTVSRAALLRFLTSTRVLRVLLIVDAINEHINPALLQRELEELAQALHGRLAKLVITCRSPDLHFFIANDSSLFRNSYKETGLSVFIIEPFRKGELAAAWSRYREAYFMSGELGPVLTEICSNPLMLRFMCEAYAGDCVPQDDIRNWQIFERYWDRKVATGAQARDREALVLGLAQLAGERFPQDSSLPLAIIREQLGPHSFDEPGVLRSLLSEGVIIYISPSDNMMAGVRFTYEAFHEFALARRYLSRRLDNNTDTLASLFLNSRRSRLIRGALEYVALGSENVDNSAAISIAKHFLEAQESVEIAVAILSKVRSQRCAAALFMEIWPQLQSQEVLNIIHRHLRSNFIEDYMADVVRLILELAPAETIRLDQLMSLVARQELPWLSSLPADKFATALGFRNIWFLSQESNPNLSAALKHSALWLDIQAIIRYATGNCRQEDLPWLRDTLARQRRKSAAGEVSDVVFWTMSRLLRFETTLTLDCLLEDGTFSFEIQKLEKTHSTWSSSLSILANNSTYVTAVGKFCSLIIEYGKMLDSDTYLDRLQAVLLTYILSTWHSFLAENGTATATFYIFNLTEDVRDCLFQEMLSPNPDSSWRDRDGLMYRRRQIAKVFRKLRKVLSGS